MLDALTDPFAGGIGLRALLETLVIATACGPLGAWVVLYRQSYAAESIAHGMLPGLVIASLAGVPLGLGAAAGLLVAAAAIALASRLPVIGPDTAVAVSVTTLFGAGALLALAPDVPARLGELLFGDPLSVSRSELLVSAAATAAILVALGLLHRPLALAGFDPRVAPSLGTRPASAELALLALLALTVFVAVQALGNLLVVAMIIAPAAAALRLTRSLGALLVTSAILAALAGVAGLYLSYYLDMAAGASIALAATAVFAATLLSGLPALVRRRGAAVAATGALLLVIAGCGSDDRLDAEEFVSMANEHGAALELGEPLPTTREDVEVYSVTLDEGPGEGHAGEPAPPMDEQLHAGGSLQVTDSGDAALTEYEECRRAGTLVCYRADNVALVFEGLAPPDRERLDEAFRAMARE